MNECVGQISDFLLDVDVQHELEDSYLTRPILTWIVFVLTSNVVLISISK